jgi:hypothetical protein
MGLREFDDVILASLADPDMRARLRKLGDRVDLYWIGDTDLASGDSTDTPDWSAYMSVSIEAIPQYGGAAADFPNHEYIELFDAEAGLSSAQWSTPEQADRFIVEAQDVLGTPKPGKSAAVRVAASKDGLKEFAADDPALVAYIRRNLANVAFCRIDLGSYSIVWSANTDEPNAPRDVRGAVIFRTGDVSPVISTIERTGTQNVKKYAAKVLPDLITFVSSRQRA